MFNFIKELFLISSDEDTTWRKIIFEWLLMVVSAPIYLYLGEIYSKIFLCSILGFVSVQMAVMMIDEEIKSEKVDVFDIIGIIFCCSVPVLLVLCLMFFSW